MSRSNKRPRNSLLHHSLPTIQISSSDSDDDDDHPLDQSLAHLLSLFPDLHPAHAASQLAQLPSSLPPDQALHSVIEYYLTHGITKAPVDAQETVENKALDSDGCFQLKEPPAEAGILYHHWCLFRMAAEFPRAKMTDLRRCLKSHKGRLGPAYRAMHHAYQSALTEESTLSTSKGVSAVVPEQLSAFRAVNNEDNNVTWLFKDRIGLMKHHRARCKELPSHPCPIFEKEWDAVMKAFPKAQKGVEMMPMKMNSEASGRDIECGCCCSDYPFEEMVQCADGHLFCSGCLRRYMEESTFGGIHASDHIPCLDTNGCTEAIPRSEVQRALPTDILLKYEQRQAEDAVACARLEGLMYCPFCNVPCEVDPEMYVLECPNKSCREVSCVKCKEPSHLPLRCEEVEKKPETALRKKIEETMTKALIRICSACKAELVKAEGCNKVTCRCGQSMCYVCRKPIARNYQHFCQHVREPGKACTMCNKCDLWQKEIEDDIVKAAKEAAMRDIEQVMPDISKRSIGPISDTVSKGLSNLPHMHMGVAHARVNTHLNGPQVPPNFHDAARLALQLGLPQFFPDT